MTCFTVTYDSGRPGETTVKIREETTLKIAGKTTVNYSKDCWVLQ